MRYVEELENQVMRLCPGRVDDLLGLEEHLIAFMEDRKPARGGGSTSFHGSSSYSSGRDIPRLLREIKQLSPDRSKEVRALCDEGFGLTQGEWAYNDDGDCTGRAKVKRTKSLERKLKSVLKRGNALLIEFRYRTATNQGKPYGPMHYVRVGPGGGDADTDDYSFVFGLIEVVGKDKLPDLVLGVGGTEADARTFVEAIDQGQEYFNKHACRDIMRRLNDLDADSAKEVLVRVASIRKDNRDRGVGKSSDYEFISRLIDRVGKVAFTQLVCDSGGTPRDAQNLLGVLQYGEDRFDSKADPKVIKKLSEFEPE